MSKNLRPGLAAGTTLFIIYVATLAPGVTLWDSGEFLAAIHSLGIPHPPGTPLYILIAKVWTIFAAPLVGFAYSVNLLSAVCTSVACGLLANLFSRWTGDRIGAFAAAVCAGSMSSVWLSATETEVYSAALLGSAVLLWIGNEAGDTSGRRWLLAGAYAAGLAWALHLAALLSVPAGLYLAIGRDRQRAQLLIRNFPAMLLVFLIGASAVLFMYIRAGHDPQVNQGNPSTWSALTDVILRRQYAPAPLWPRQAPWFIQLGNPFEYADWQIALGLSPGPPPSWLRTPLTFLFGLLGGLGSLFHRRVDRRSWNALIILFVTATLGVIVYLNLKAGASYGAGFVADNAPHEARDRDYFFSLAFVCWGLWAGFGAVSGARWFSRGTSASLRWLPLAGVSAAFVPVALNWSAVNRRREPDASDARLRGLRILDAAAPRALVFARGDNETYPVWYMQEVERHRPDVTVVVVPLLPARWYRAELARRERLLDVPMVTEWRGDKLVLANICANAGVQQRRVGTAGSGSDDSFPSQCKSE